MSWRNSFLFYFHSTKICLNRKFSYVGNLALISTRSVQTTCEKPFLPFILRGISFLSGTRINTMIRGLVVDQSKTIKEHVMYEVSSLA